MNANIAILVAISSKIAALFSIAELGIFAAIVVIIDVLGEKP